MGIIDRLAQASPPQVYHSIGISVVSNGYVVNVGCKSFIIDSLDDLLEGIEAFLSDPDGVSEALGYGNPGGAAAPAPYPAP